MAERTIEQATEDSRRAAVRAIAAGASGLSKAQEQVRGIQDTATGIGATLDAQAQPFGIPELAAALRARVEPALTSTRGFAPATEDFERRIVADQLGGVGRFFGGVRSATPIVRSTSDAARAQSETDVLQALIQQELGAAQGGFSLSEALERRRAAREAQDFARQQFQQQMALRQAEFDFARQQAARAAASDALQQSLIREQLGQIRRG